MFIALSVHPPFTPSPSVTSHILNRLNGWTLRELELIKPIPSYDVL